MAEIVGPLMNTALQIEPSRYLKAGLYEKKDGRLGYAKGYKPKTMKTRFGEVNLAIP